jgi:hypothetical protein
MVKANEKPPVDAGLHLILNASRHKHEDSGVWLWYSFTMLIVGLLVILAWPFFLARNWQFIRTLLEPTWLKICATGFLVVFAAFLYAVRTHFRFFYGTGEIAVGVASSWVGLSYTATDALPSALAIAAGVYVMVRGIDNCFEAVKVAIASVRD